MACSWRDFVVPNGGQTLNSITLIQKLAEGDAWLKDGGEGYRADNQTILDHEDRARHVPPRSSAPSGGEGLQISRLAMVVGMPRRRPGDDNLAMAGVDWSIVRRRPAFGLTVGAHALTGCRGVNCYNTDIVDG